MGIYQQQICGDLEISNIMSKFTNISTNIADLYIIEPYVFGDQRGYFFEAYNKKDFFDIGLTLDFVQDNESLSVKNVLRGLHVQKRYPQGKLVRVLNGAIYDIAVDLRKNSSSFGKWCGVELSEDNKRQFYIPEGFAHGFYVLSDYAKVLFKVTDYWHPNDEIGIPWDDSLLGIDWHIPNGEKPIIAEKDMHYLPLAERLESEITDESTINS